ncbi:unnamed protein product [Durusdinium trenchii]|uniref:Uncharacterized protein n=2 Tax=Durusdinium trenchii TaxID=1381693 RepID=A0ABP0HFS5_9DINO
MSRRLHSLDWPLSQEEKRGRLLQLYDKDVQAAEQLLRSNDANWHHQELANCRPIGGAPGSFPASSPIAGQDSFPALPWQFWSKATETAISLGLFFSRLTDELRDDAPLSLRRLRARSEKPRRVSFAESDERTKSGAADGHGLHSCSDRRSRRSMLRGRLHGFSHSESGPGDR